MVPSHSEAEKRYKALRESAISAIQTGLGQRAGYEHIRLSTIDNAALIASKKWLDSTNRRVGWDWFEGYSSFAFRFPKRFELAVWEKGVLMSLSLGQPTRHGSALRLDFIEANPDEVASVKLFPISVIAMYSYAEMIGASELRLFKPINDTVRQYYEENGFVYVKKGNYLYMRM